MSLPPPLRIFVSGLSHARARQNRVRSRSSLAPPARARRGLRPISRDRQATARRASLASGRGAGSRVERTVVWLRGRRLLADDGENDRSRWLIDRLPGGDGDGRSYSNDDVIEIAVIPEPADPRRIRRARIRQRSEQERDGNENHRHDGPYQVHAREPSANIAGLQSAS